MTTTTKLEWNSVGGGEYSPAWCHPDHPYTIELEDDTFYHCYHIEWLAESDDWIGTFESLREAIEFCEYHAYIR